MEISHTEENYLKAIFKISEKKGKAASTNAISSEMKTSAASVTDMVKRLSEKELIHYERYKGVTLTRHGLRIATHLIRKHRLWEVFLVDKLSFNWDEVHEIAEQLEHIKSPELVERLDEYLGTPKFDPHGDPIPDKEGNFAERKQVLLADMKAGETGIVVGVQDHTTAFLQYLDRMQLVLGTSLQVLECFDYDESLKIRIGNGREETLSKKVSQNLFVQKEV
ncbi:metal-dependent transcriptional regulator [Phaeodactylibacter luteus]|uniref:Transcriptional regulator MntR n=1 Tax=Phaeodactylibacter luteus TaxID=1564516 RepID=A0A5C6RJB0_9BACT|nr:metal-dependent transcriptional regulator [Phaeodactylibacter luteus]TXB61442.1 metal-dependent transcriptional regulator [Phaeodactylibacter luteus]